MKSTTHPRRRTLRLEALEDRRVLTSYFVAPTGKDTNSGTFALPYATIGHALQTATQPHDQVVVRAGTYAEHLQIPHGGDASGNFTLRAYGTERPVISGGGVGGDVVQLTNISYFTLRGFEIAHGSGMNDASGIRILGGGSHVQIRNNILHDLHGRSAMGITVYGTSNTAISQLTIDGNEIYDAQPSPSEALTLNGNVVNFMVSNNIVHDVNNIGIDVIAGEKSINPTFGARNGTISGNTVYRARSNYGGGYAGGIYVDGASHIIVEKNISYQNDMGIEIGAENRGITAVGVTVRNNLIYNNDKAGLVFGGYAANTGRVNNSRFYNNTIVGNDTLNDGNGQLWIQYAASNIIDNNILVAAANGVLISSSAGNGNNTIDYNNWYSTTSAVFTWNGHAYDTFAAYRTATHQDAHSLFADPQFVNQAALNFRLTASSPAIDHGSARINWFAATDLAGVTRPKGTAPDMGAYEYLASSQAAELHLSLMGIQRSQTDIDQE